MFRLLVTLVLVAGVTRALTIQRSLNDNEKWGAVVDKIHKESRDMKDVFRETMKKQDEIEEELNELEISFKRTEKDASKPEKDTSKPEKDASKTVTADNDENSLEGEALMNKLIKEQRDAEEERKNEISTNVEDEDVENGNGNVEEDQDVENEEDQDVENEEDQYVENEGEFNKRQIVIDEESEDASRRIKNGNLLKELEDDDDVENEVGEDEASQINGVSLVNKDHGSNENDEDDSTAKLIMKLSHEDDRK